MIIDITCEWKFWGLAFGISFKDPSGAVIMVGPFVATIERKK